MFPAGYDKRQFKRRLRQIIGCRPGDISLYEAAFTHRSASYTLPNGQNVNNERLEFLGDAVIETILSEYLFERFPDADEGTLTKMRARVVSREDLNKLALKLNIGAMLINYVPNNGNVKNIYGDAIEAFVGALFLDKGYRRTKKIFISRILETYLNIDDIANRNSDYKSLIHEWSQKNKKIFCFDTREECANNIYKRQPTFSSTLFIENKCYGRGVGHSKKEAEQIAAKEAWINIEQ